VFVEETISAGPDKHGQKQLLVTLRHNDDEPAYPFLLIHSALQFEQTGGVTKHFAKSTDEERKRIELRVTLIAKVARALQSIQVQLPFETLPMWASRSFKRSSAMREDNIVEPFERLEPLGSNLSSAYFALRNELGDAHWRETLELIRLGLGDVEDVLVRAGGDGGKISLRVQYRSQRQPVPTFALSDGTLAYLAWVALYRAPRPFPPALLAFDEPELHLHPHLLMRVLDFLESLGQTSPVLVATHSDRLLDGLSRPAEQAVLCELDDQGRTQLRRPDKESLARWMERYRGIGELRGAGHDASIWADEEPAAEKP
jgi:predicted ATPase